MAKAMLPDCSASAAAFSACCAAAKCCAKRTSLVGSGSGWADARRFLRRDAPCFEVELAELLLCPLLQVVAGCDPSSSGASPIVSGLDGDNMLPSRRRCLSSSMQSCCTLDAWSARHVACRASASPSESELSPDSLPPLQSPREAAQFSRSSDSTLVTLPSVGSPQPLPTSSSKEDCVTSALPKRRNRPRSARTSSAESHAALHELLRKSFSPTAESLTSSSTARARPSRRPPS
mmetsp:Transcript_11507/g.26675  ORF Transcript_11507/g.26675 Transcript_11507/m.26675 type:complete len:234 (-) Transcript_11507:255-956(-)